jgi:type IX secretion system PorP/SprF family membrane protein
MTVRVAYIILFFFLSAGLVRAQQEWLYTQHTFNLYDVNAAYAGDGEHGSAAFRYRNQWTGLNGAPKSMMASMHNQFKKQQLAWGMRLFREEIGAHRESDFNASLSYRIAFRASWRMSFAMRAGMGNQVFDISKLVPAEIEDPALLIRNQSKWSPQLAAAFLLRSDKLYVGAEFTRLLPSVYIDNSGNSRYFRHYYLNAGWLTELHPNWMLRSSFMLRGTENLYFQPELHLAALYAGKCWMGAGYRKDFGFVAYTELLLSPYFRIGYSFDMPTHAIRPGNSHEIFAGIQFKRKGGRVPSIRYF